MNQKEITQIMMTEERELDDLTIESPLYLDLSLLEREKFVHYLASIILH